MAVAVAALDNKYVPSPPEPDTNADIVVSAAIPAPMTMLPTDIAPLAMCVTVRVVDPDVVEHITSALLFNPAIVFCETTVVPSGIPVPAIVCPTESLPKVIRSL